jgi:hypothetical protein
MEESASTKTAPGKRRITLDCIHNEGDQFRAAGLEHSSEKADEYRWPGHESRGEPYRFVVATGRNRRDSIIQNALVSPTYGELLMLRPGSFLASYISRTMLEELPERLPRRLSERGGLQCRGHMLQPRAPLGGSNAEAHV